MSLVRLYTRVLELLGNEARLGWLLAGANLVLAAAQFAEPVLFGRIVDVLSGKPAPGWSSSAWPLLAAWAAFGLLTIGSGAAVALHADRLAHRQRAAGDPAVRALRGVHGVDHGGGAQNLRHAKRGRGALQRSFRPRIGRARQ